MTNKKIIVISLIILIMGIGLFSYGIFNYRNTTKNDKVEDNDTPIIDNSKNNDYEKKVSISNFIIENNEENYVTISFDIANNSGEIINGKDLKINFYNESELIYTYEYTVEELNIYDQIGIKTDLELEIQTITKYEFEIDDYKEEIIPIEK